MRPGGLDRDMPKQVCTRCITQTDLIRQARGETHNTTCSYCDRRRQCVPLEWLAERVDEVYRQHVRPSGHDIFSGESPAEVIGQMLECDQPLADDLARELSQAERYAVMKDGADAFYDSTTAYEIRDPPNPLAFTWNAFVESVKHESRFFSADHIASLNELFAGLAQLKSRGKAPVRSIGPGTDERHLFRARRANDERERIAMCLSPGRELGPPPKLIAPAGRMNAAGIPVFYGALDAETCVAELRLGIGECAVSCSFEVTRAMHVLDLTGLSELYNQASLFHPDYDTISERLAFLHDFNATISRPVRPGAELDYLPTQALAEYLARHYDPRIDAVIYSSTQAGRSARNIVLLSHAAIVKGIGRQPSPRYEENWTDRGYAIWDRLGARRKKRKFAATFDFAGDGRYESRPPKATLKFVEGSVSVHRVDSLTQEITTDAVRLPVMREKDLPF